MRKHSLAIIACLIALIVFTDRRSFGASVFTSRVGCPAISVESLDRAVAFYTKLLDFTMAGVEDSSAPARLAPEINSTTNAKTGHLTLGDDCLDLTEYTHPRGKPFPADSSSNDRWFEHIAIVVADIDKAYARLRQAHVRQVSSMPQILPEWNRDAAGISAFYFRDPDGHYLELIHFPRGKGLPKWQRTSQSLFLGMDHTAIVVYNTERSLAFYRDELHLNVAGNSENYGTEQEHLSGLFNAHVLITSLRASSGIGIELLDYVTPTNGRDIPPDLQVNDLACWQIRMDVTSVSSDDDPAFRTVKWITLPGESRSAAWIRDPDGHILELQK